MIPLRRRRCCWLTLRLGAGLAALSTSLAGTTLTVDDVIFQETNSGTVAVRYQSDVAVAAGQFDVVFDPAAYVSSAAIVGTLPENYRVDSRLMEPGRLRVVVGAPGNPTVPDGTLFQIPLTATSGFASLFPIRLANVTLSTAASGPVGSQIAPSVTLLNLADGQVVNGQHGIQLTLEANATNGAIARVEYYANGSKIGESTVSPFSFFWNPPASGTFVLQVVAFDTNGLHTSSRSISIVVTGIAPTPTPTPSPTPSPTPPARVKALNISTRMKVEAGDNVLIGGFIIDGNAPKTIAARAVGPSLAAFGISDFLADPTLELRDSGGVLIALNDGWQDDPAQAVQLAGLGLALADPRESGIVATLQPGAYTAIVAGKNLGTGVGLVEIYDTDATASSELANISARGFVRAGNNVMIGGFILGGNGTGAIALRGVGPSLAAFGLDPVLDDPTLELHDQNGTLLVLNDNWQDDPVQAALLANSGLALSDANESGIFVSLPPGAFTAILAGKNGGMGIGVVEIYNIR